MKLTPVSLELLPIMGVFSPKLVVVKHDKNTEFSLAITTILQGALIVVH